MRRDNNTKATEDQEPLFNFDLGLPKIKPLSFTKGSLVFGGLLLIGAATMGAVISTYLFFGTLTLLGFVAIIESNKYIKYLVMRSSKTVDLTIFIASLYATAHLGVTITAVYTIAGLGYTLVVAPYYRKQLRRNRNK